LPLYRHKGSRLWLLVVGISYTIPSDALNERILVIKNIRYYSEICLTVYWNTHYMVASIGISNIKEPDTLENLLLNMFDYVLE